MPAIKVRQKKYANLSTVIRALGEGEYEGVVASNDEDRYGEILDIKGLDTSAFMKTNPIVLFGHAYNNIDDVMGKATSMRKTKDGQLVAKFQLSRYNPRARLADALMQEGILNTLSIGFIPKEIEGNTYTKSEMVEFSIVPVPANAAAVLTARKLGLEAVVKDVLTGDIPEVHEEADCEIEQKAENVSNIDFFIGLLQDLAVIDVIVDRWQVQLSDYLGVQNPDTGDDANDDDAGSYAIDDNDGAGGTGEGQDTGEASNTVRDADDISIDTKLNLKDASSINEFVAKLKDVVGVLESKSAELSPQAEQTATARKRIVRVVSRKEIISTAKQADRLVERVLAELHTN